MSTRINRGRAHRQELFEEGVKRQEARDARTDAQQLASLPKGAKRERARLEKRIAAFAEKVKRET